MSYIVKRTDEVPEGTKRLYYQEGYEPDFANWAFVQKQATRFETKEAALKSAHGWHAGRFKVIKLVPKKVTT